MSGGFTTERLEAEPLARSHDAELAGLHADPQVMGTTGGRTATAGQSRAWLERNLVGFAYERDVVHQDREQALYRRRSA